MKAKSIAFMILILVAVTALIHFLSDANQEALQGKLVFLGLEFSVIRGLALVTLIGALVPAILLSMKYLGLARLLKQTQLEQKSWRDERSRLQKCSDLLAHGQPDGVLTNLNGSVEPEARLLIARAHLAKNDQAAAEPILRELWDVQGMAQAGYLLAESMTAQGLSPATLLREMIEADPKHAGQAAVQWFDHMDQRGDWQEAERIFGELQKAGARFPDDLAMALRFEAIRASEDDNLKGAISAYQKLIKQAPGFVPAHMALADLHLGMGSEEKAFRAFEQGYEKTKHPVFLDRLQQCYLAQDRPEDAIRVLRQVQVKQPSPALAFQLGKLYQQLQMNDEALTALEPLKSQLGKLPSYQRRMADLHERRTHLDQAIQAYRDLLEGQEVHCEDYLCSFCLARYEAWQARCNTCFKWNSVNLEVDEVDWVTPATAPLYY